MPVRRRTRRPRCAALAALAVLLTGACTGQPTEPPTGAPAPSGSGPATVSGDAAGEAAVLVADGRPFELVVPPGHDASRPAPLVLALHGFGAEPADADAILGLREEARERGVLYALPQGTENSRGQRFWNATDACCDLEGSGVDDLRYLERVIDAVEDRYAVDPAHVALVGHSNGGFMAYRAACRASGRVTAVVSVAGAMPTRASACAPSAPVTAVQVHGTADVLVGYDGGTLYGSPIPTARDSIAAWARLDECEAPAVDRGTTDLETWVAGAETEVTAYPGCDRGTRVELWTVRDGGHVPAFGDGFADAVLDVVTGEGRP